MCSHTLAAAEAMGVLKEFLKLFQSKKRSPHLSAIANVNMPKNAGQKVGTRKRKGGNNMPSTEGRQVVSSRVLQPSFIPLSSTILSSHAVAGTSDQCKEGRLAVCDRVLQPSFAPVSHEISSCTYVSDQSTPP